jgi:hypothetical protein
LLLRSPAHCRRGRAEAHIDQVLPEKWTIITLAVSASAQWKKLFIMTHLYTDESSL